MLDLNVGKVGRPAVDVTLNDPDSAISAGSVDRILSL